MHRFGRRFWGPWWFRRGSPRELVRGHGIRAVAAWLLFAAIAPASALETKGYMRAGTGAARGGGQACFGLDGAMTKYRLGNECEVYGEVALSHAFATQADGSSVEAIWRGAVYNRNDRKLRFGGTYGGYSNAEAWVRWRDLPWLNGGSLWGGRRYYRRNDVHIADFFYWNPTGLGAGVEDIGLRNGAKLSYALFRRGVAADKRYITRHDLQLTKLQTNPGGMVDLGLSVIPRPAQAGAYGGWSMIAQHEQARVLGGLHRLILQYGTGPGIGLSMAGDLYAAGARRLRLIDRLDWQPTERFGGQAMLAWQRDWRRDAPTQDWWSMGARPTYAFSQHFKLALDLGLDRVQPRGGQARWLRKVTLAGIVARGPAFWRRPELRVFYTYADWNQAAQWAAAAGSALAADGVFGGATSGSSVGVQVETWW
ncbi:MAG TPA: carbohydrate porin [Stenotrophomonas sp.]|nr:carbohydrate porin [Stenotrophomonas sp.]